jgi:hypothetical protein
MTRTGSRGTRASLDGWPPSEGNAPTVFRIEERREDDDEYD